MCFESTFFSSVVFLIHISEIALTQCRVYALRDAKCKKHLFQLFSTVSCRKKWRYFSWNFRKFEKKFELYLFFENTFLKTISQDCVHLVLFLRIVKCGKNIEHQVYLFATCCCRKNRKVILKFSKNKNQKRFLRDCLS